MKKFALLLALSVSAFAEVETKVVEIRNLNPSELGGFLGSFGVFFNSVPRTRFIALRGEGASVTAAVEALKRMDVPSKNIELSFQILAAGGQPSTEKLPADLEPVVKQLKSSFLYQGYKLVDSMFVRTREGGDGRASGFMPSPPNTPRGPMLEVEFRSTSVTAESSGVIVHIDRLRFNGRVVIGTNKDGSTNYGEAGIQANVDVREGQKVVVGKSNVEGKEGAVFMIVTAKVVD